MQMRIRLGKPSVPGQSHLNNRIRREVNDLSQVQPRDMQEMNNKYWLSVLIIALMILYVLALVAQIRVP